MSWQGCQTWRSDARTSKQPHKEHSSPEKEIVAVFSHLSAQGHKSKPPLSLKFPGEISRLSVPPHPSSFMEKDALGKTGECDVPWPCCCWACTQVSTLCWALSRTQVALEGDPQPPALIQALTWRTQEKGISGSSSWPQCKPHCPPHVIFEGEIWSPSKSCVFFIFFFPVLGIERRALDH